MNRWGSEGPPPEAYSRVTDPERFRSLHNVALGLLEQLQAAFNVERFEGYGLDAELESGDLVRPSVRLVPRDPKASESPGTDVRPINEKGVTAISPLQDAHHYFDYHHTAADTFDKVRIDEMRGVIEVITPLVYALAQRK